MFPLCTNKRLKAFRIIMVFSCSRPTAVEFSMSSAVNWRAPVKLNHSLTTATFVASATFLNIHSLCSSSYATNLTGAFNLRTVRIQQPEEAMLCLFIEFRAVNNNSPACDQV